MHIDGFDNILMEFAPAFDCIKLLCRNLRDILFLFIETEKLNLRTSVNSKTLYKFIIKVFENAIANLNINM